MNTTRTYRWLLIVTLLFFAAGCGAIDKRMESWRGAHYSTLIASWGPPQQILDDGYGGRIFVFSAVRTFTSPGQATTHVTGSAYGYGNQAFGSATGYTTYTPAQTTSYTAHRMFWTNSDGYVYRWAWRGL